jgi:hypothetical protein
MRPFWRYRISEVWGDRAFAGFHSDGWLRNEVAFSPVSADDSENYLAALPRLLAGRVRLTGRYRSGLKRFGTHEISGKKR